MQVDGFDRDDGNWPKCGKHGVSKAEVEFVLRGVPAVRPDRAPQDSETRFNAVGRNADGRHVFVALTLRSKQGGRLLRPISARYMHQKEVDRYERRND